MQQQNVQKQKFRKQARMKKKSRIIAINGESWCRTVTGIERVAIETTKELDRLAESGKIELVVPKNAQNLPELKNIKIVRLEAVADDTIHLAGTILLGESPL